MPVAVKETSAVFTAADAGRGVGAGKFFTRDHRHLATVVQEGIFRSA